jgi:hypothetical protein
VGNLGTDQLCVERPTALYGSPVTAKKSILSLIWRQQALRYRFVQTNSARSLASTMVQTHRRGEKMSQGNPTGRKGDAPFRR